MDVTGWLRGLGLEIYAPAFEENCIDAPVLRQLTEQDLRELGVSALGHRKKLLAAIAALDDAACETRAPDEAARREASILFVDLDGYTALGERLDPEDAHDLLNRYFALVDGIVAEFGGHVDKHVGDAVMAVFGAPVSHGDDPWRAVAAAAAVREAVARLGGEIGQSLSVHAGIACGEVLASGTGSALHTEYTVTGGAVNLASRLEALAGHGEIVVSDAVRRAVGDAVDAAPAGAASVAGIEAPVTTWRIEAVLGRQPGERAYPFVGRRAELGQFASILDACLHAGAGQTVAVRGEAGIGKTRLAEECARVAAGKGARVCWSLVLDFGERRGRDVVRSLARAFLGLSAEAEEPTCRAAAEKARGRLELTPAQAAALNDLLDVPQPGKLRATFEAMDNAARNAVRSDTACRLLQAAAAAEPLLLVMEDVHWADPRTLEDLGALARTAGECPALVLVTARPEGDPLDAAWRARLAGASLTTIDLSPLRPDEAAKLARAIAETGDDALRRAIERADGNPLFLEQLLLSGRETLDARLPGTLQSLVQARMDALPAADRRALQAAAVLGQRFEPEALRAVIGVDRYDCRALVRHYLARPQGDAFLFAHALVRDAVYATLPRAGRRKLHLQAARWYRQRDATLHAEHLDLAADRAAPAAYLDAARMEREAARYDAALRLLERGRALAERVEDRFELTQLHAHVLYDLGHIGEAIEAYRESAEATDGPGRARALIGLANALRAAERIEEAAKPLDEAEGLAVEHGMSLARSRIHHLRGNLYFPVGRTADCRREHERALALAREAGSPEAEADALGGIGDAAYAAGHMITAHRSFDACVAVCREHGLRRIELANAGMIGHTKHYLLEFEDELDISRRVADAAQEIGHWRAELNALATCALASFDLDRLEEARAYVQRTVELVERSGAGRFKSTALNVLGHVLREEGRQQEAVETIRLALEAGRQTGITFEGPRTLANLACTTDDADERARALREGEDIIGRGCLAHGPLLFYRFAIEAMLRQQGWAGAERYAGLLEDFAADEPLPWSAFFCEKARVLAGLGRTPGNPDLRARLQTLRAQAKQRGMARESRAIQTAAEAACGP